MYSTRSRKVTHAKVAAVTSFVASDPPLPCKRQRDRAAAAPSSPAGQAERASLSHGGDDQHEDAKAGLELPAGGCFDPCVWTPSLLAVAQEGCTDWSALGVSPVDLRLASTLMSGQSFRWERRVVNSAGTQGARAQFPADMATLAEGIVGPAGCAFVEYVGPVESHLFVLRETA